MEQGCSNRCQHKPARLQMQLKNPMMDFLIDAPSCDLSAVRTSLTTGKLKKGL